jgi:DNA-binding transcriptional LysR family regulator
MDLVQIRHFLTLARTVNFTRAAEECNITQPAFSRSIQRLEEELGGPLVLRERSLTQLTELGRLMLPLLQSTHDAAEAVRARVAEHRRADDAAPLRIGLAPSIPFDAMSLVLKEVATHVQSFEMALRRGGPAELVDTMLHGAIDLVVMPEGDALPDRVKTWPLWQESVVVIAPEGHSFAALERVEAAALEGETLVEADPPGACASVVRRLATDHGVNLRALHRGVEQEIASLVALGLGIALAPAATLLPAGVVARPLVAPEFSHRVLLGAVSGRPMNRAASAFLKLARARRWMAGEDGQRLSAGAVGA